MLELEFDKMLVLKPEKELMKKSLLEFSPICPTSMSNILDKEPYPTDLDLAHLACAVKLWKTEADYENALPEGWLLLTTGSNPKNKKYFGSAYVHHKAQQVVVAHHETTEAINKDSSKMIKRHAVCINSATTFMNYIREGIREVNAASDCSYNLTVTGHRLGGWLAQIAAFTAKYLSIEDDLFKMDVSSGLHTKTVVFDSPGARDLLNTLLDVYYDRYTMNVFNGLYITVYVSTQNEINTCGLHLGKVYSVSNNNDVKTEKGNPMKYFIDVFEKDVPEICEIVDWARNANEFSSNKKTTNKDSKDDQPNCLSKKSHRQTELKSQPNDENVWSHFKIFAEDELKMLFKLHIIQEQKQKGEILIEFISNIEKEIKISTVFPSFEMDLYNRIMHCESRISLDELTKRLKQLMRFLKTQFTAAVEKQIADFPQATDLIYRAEGLSYLGSTPKSTLDFTDSIGLEDFLFSDTLQILQVDTQDGAFEMTRLQNIFFQIKNRKDLPPKINKYSSDKHHTFIKWPRLQKLYIFGSPIDQNDLMMVDGSSSSTMSEEDVKPLIKDLKSLSPTLKKLVIILSKPTKIFDSMKNIKIKGIINFKNLSVESQTIAFKKKKLIFTGNKGYSLQEFMGENSNVDEVSEFLPSDCLKNIATNEDYVMNVRGTRPTFDLHPQMPLYRTNFKTSKDFIIRCAESSNSTILVVVSGVSHEELKTRPGWEQLVHTVKEVTLHQSDEDAKLSFYRMCNKYPEKSIYLLAVSEEDVNCKLIFNPAFYLSRKFFHRAFIDPQEFVKTNFNDDLVVICSEEEKALLENYCMETKKNTEIIIAAAKEREAEIIKENFHKNIHFIKIGNKHDIRGNRNELILEWRYSHGSAENLRHCVSMNSCEPIDEATLALTERNIVILTDDPGTGKTTTLASLSRQLESEWVIYIRLKNFKKNIEKLAEKLDARNVASFLLSECTHANSTLDNRLLKYLLEKNMCFRRIVVMFAGFDELDDFKDEEKNSAKKKIIGVINFLKNKPTVQIFLTTRKYLKEFLELEFGQISTSFKGMSKQEQLDLLVKFWLSCPSSLELGSDGEEEERRLEAHAGELLRGVKRVLSPDNDCFMGVPLHMKMLAEDFRPQSERQIDLISLPNLFKWYMNLKYKIYYHDKVSLKIQDIYLVNPMGNLTMDHCKLGFRTFFPAFYVTHFNPITDERLMKFNRYGLLQSRENGEFQFVYRTIAEYCCAQMVVHWLKQGNLHYTYPLIKEILLPQILLLPDSKPIRRFMNVEFNETPMSCDALELSAVAISEFYLEAIASVKLKKQKNETALHIAIHEMNEHIVKLLLSGSGSNSENSQRAFVYLMTQHDKNNDTPLNIVQGYLSNTSNISEDASFFNRILKNILQRIETCSYELKQSVHFASLLNQNMSKKHLSNLIFD